MTTMTTVGLCLPQLGEHVDGPTLRRFCTRAEELGFAGLWVQEHLFWPIGGAGYAGIPGRPIPDQYRSVLSATETMAAAAAWTSTVGIGSSILVGGYHRPVQLAQALSTIDLVSGGRLIVGLGVGWSDEEHAQAGVDPRSRGRRMDELVAALRACWGPDPVEHTGDFFEIPSAEVRPKPVQRPHPTLVSGMWSKAGLERTVRDFDGWNPAGIPADRVAELVADMDTRRTAEQGPLAVYHRVFLQGPGGPPIGIDAAVAETAAAAGHEFDQVIVDANFWDDMDSPAAWVDLPDRALPLLEAVAG